MKMKWVSLMAVAAVFLASCAAPVHVEKDDSVDLSHYSTYAWISKTDSKEKNRANDMMEQKFKEAVTGELRKHGWKMDNTRPDVLISYDVLVERGNRQQSDAVYSQPFTRTYYNPYYRRFFSVYYPSQFMGYDDYSVAVRQGTVTITVTDAATDKAVWQGWTTDEVNSRNLTSQEINSAVKSIFKKFNNDVARR